MEITQRNSELTGITRYYACDIHLEKDGERQIANVTVTTNWDSNIGRIDADAEIINESELGLTPQESAQIKAEVLNMGHE